MKKGRCYICNDFYSENGMARHIKTCLEKIKGAKVNRNYTSDSAYLIKVEAKYNIGYYLYLMVDGCVLLREMDQYLKDIWVECCGHLSKFVINGIKYERYPDDEWGNSEDMDIEIDEVLDVGMSFTYIYDYGSTTELELKVMEKYEPLFPDRGIRLIGRNLPVEYKCFYCNNLAKLHFYDVYSGKQGFVCEFCMKKMQTENKEVYFTDIINSPRVGVCGYNGPTDDIMFMEHREVKNRKKRKEKKVASVPDDKLTFIEKLLNGKLSEEDMEEQQLALDDLLYRIANLTSYRPRSMPPFMIKRCKLDGHMLKDYLSLLRKNELDVIRKKLNIEKASELKKDELIELINQFLLDNIENILAFLPQPSYIAISEIHKTGEAFWEESKGVPKILADLRNKGLLFTVCGEDEEKYEWVIPDDIKMVLEKLKANADFQKRRMFTDKISKIIISIFYYWGIVQKYDLMKETARLLDLSIDDEFTTAFENIFKNMEKSYTESERIGTKVYYNMFAENVSKKILSSEWQKAEYPLISKEMIPEGNEGWLSLVLHSPYFKWVYEVMGQVGQAGDKEIDNDEEACELVSGVAQISLNIKPGTDIRQLAKELEMQDEVLTVPFIRELLNNILLYTPNYWIKGNSISGEIHVCNEQYKEWNPKSLPPKNLVKGRGKNSAGTAASRWKVGRNDPCPCGSGKKFKHCCGK